MGQEKYTPLARWSMDVSNLAQTIMREIARIRAGQDRWAQLKDAHVALNALMNDPPKELL